MTAYYNEIDPYAAEWLRNLVSQGLIAPGDVDERSIEDVRPDDLRGYTQCHFFAGIGVWSYALRLAGWPDDRPVWTGSCPCPPFSQAGKGSECPSCGGKSCLSHPVVTAGWVCLDCGDEWRGDDRHLLPEFIRLIGECGPSVTFGEQVASRDGRLWLYTLRAVMEVLGHAFGAADTCSAGSGAPHIRQRLRFVAERVGVADSGGSPTRRQGSASLGQRRPVVAGSRDGRLADDDQRLEGRSGKPERGTKRAARAGSLDDRLADADNHEPRRGRDSRGPQGEGLWPKPRGRGDAVRVADNTRDGRREKREDIGGEPAGDRSQGLAAESCAGNGDRRPGPVNGFWRDADWLFCRDGKWRPVEPGTFPLAHGAPARVGRLRAYGNAIDAEATRHFIEAYLDTERLRLTETSIMTTDEGVFG